MTGRRTLNLGLGLCAVLAAVDIIGLVGFVMPDDAPPASKARHPGAEQAGSGVSVDVSLTGGPRRRD